MKIMLIAILVCSLEVVAVDGQTIDMNNVTWQYKAPCNPYTTEQTTDVVPGYYYNISGQCIPGNVEALQYATPHEYNDHGMLFYNGYFPKWDNPPMPNYYSNQTINSNERERR